MSGCSTNCQRKIPSSTPGAPGKNAYTFLTASFTMPAASATVTVTVSNAGQFGNRWASVGQVIFVEGAGYFTVTAIVGTNQLTLFNLNYDGNATAGATIASGGYISPAGPRGIQGIAGNNGTAGTARLYELLTPQANNTTISPTWAIVAGFNLPPNTFVNDGDSVFIKALYRQANTAPLSFLNIPFRRVTFGGPSITLSDSLEVPSFSISTALFRSEIEIIKSGANSVLVRNFHDGNVSEYQYISYQTVLTGVNFAVGNPLFFSVIQHAVGTHILESLTIDKIVS